MKVLTDVEGKGMLGLIGKRVTLFCANYIYTGILSGINDDCVLLTEAAIVYETGSLDSKTWKDVQELPHDWNVMKSAIESFGELK